MTMNRPCRRTPHFLPDGRRSAAIFCGLALLLLQPASFGQSSDAPAMDTARAIRTTATCDPPGPPPRFGCQWSTDVCDWICAVCDPFGAPPRSSCHWDGNVCNWICPGYTGVEVTVRTTQPPVQDATVYLRLSSLCTATGAGAFCSGSFAVYPGMSVSQKCQAIADAISNNCSPAGYAVTENDCRLAATLTASNLGCPQTEFALGLSNDPGVFDQTGQGPLPDGESDRITGTTSACAPMPGPVANLRLATANGGADLQMTWDDTTNADDYVVFSDTKPNGMFSAVEGTAPSGTPGPTLSMPPGSEFYLIAGDNSTCGVGPRR
jgi:hypothetical protein